MKKNKANYGVAYPLRELDNIETSGTIIEDYLEKRLARNLQPLETDPDYFFFARTGSRLKLLYLITKALSINNLKPVVFDRVRETMIKFVDDMSCRIQTSRMT